MNIDQISFFLKIDRHTHTTHKVGHSWDKYSLTEKIIVVLKYQFP